MIIIFLTISISGLQTRFNHFILMQHKDKSWEQKISKKKSKVLNAAKYRMRRTIVTSSGMQSPVGLVTFNWVTKISAPPAINCRMPCILLLPVAVSVEFLQTEATPELSARGLCSISPCEDSGNPHTLLEPWCTDCCANYYCLDWE